MFGHDAWGEKRERAIQTKDKRTYNDVEYVKVKEANKYTVMLDAVCSKTGCWLGRFELLYPHFVDDKPTEKAHNYLESVLLKNKVISPRECGLDEELKPYVI